MTDGNDTGDKRSPGGHHERINDNEILAYLDEQDGEPVIASELAEVLDRSRRGVYHRLDQLAEDGVIEHKKFNDRMRVFWLNNTDSE